MEFEYEESIVKNIVINNEDFIFVINSYKYNEYENFEVEIYTKQSYEEGDYCFEMIHCQNKSIEEVVKYCAEQI